MLHSFHHNLNGENMRFGIYFNPTLILSLALMLIISMMILPVHPVILDLGLALSFSLAILIFVVTLFIERPLDFSSFPTILLATLMLRLSLNVSSTKLIIGDGHTGTQAAGGVIQGFATFIMGGSVFMGLIVFLVLLIVNFMVITKGAARMAEVGARFALDGMPGKQMAIDSDVAAGALTHAEATKRREQEQRETTFFGSLDGASKFVKGDAVAGLLITLLNLCAGLVMGVIFHDMPLGTAFETYAALTVGDGLVSQIPAVIISIASALLLARGGTTGSTDVAIFDQLGRYPIALVCVGGLSFLFAILPGLPFFPFLLGSVALLSFGYWSYKNPPKLDEVEIDEIAPNSTKDASMGDLMELDDIHVEFSPDLVNMMLDPSTGLDARIVNMRRHVATTFGLILPEIRLSDQVELNAGDYVIRILGVAQASGHLESNQIMALLPATSSGSELEVPVSEPVYGAPAKWIRREDREDAAMQGLTLVTPEEILATHLLETIKRNMPRLLSLKALRRIIQELTSLSDSGRAESNQRLVDELIPDRVPIDLLHAVLKLLLEEQVSIRNFPLILETIAEGRLKNSSAEAVCEHVRQRLGFQMVANLKRPDGTLPLIQLDSEWENVFSEYQVGSPDGIGDIALPPDVFNSLAGHISATLQNANENNISPALVTNTHRRRFLKTLTKAKGISIPVLSFEEVGTEASPSLVGVVPQ